MNVPWQQILVGIFYFIRHLHMSGQYYLLYTNKCYTGAEVRLSYEISTVFHKKKIVCSFLCWGEKCWGEMTIFQDPLLQHKQFDMLSLREGIWSQHIHSQLFLLKSDEIIQRKMKMLENKSSKFSCAKCLKLEQAYNAPNSVFIPKIEVTFL